MHLLHIDSSILGEYSVSRVISAEIVARLGQLHPGLEVTYKDLGSNPSPHLTGAHMAAFQGAPVNDAALGADIALGATYIEELFAADVIVIGAPMYNFTIPTQLKAWIDRIVVVTRTFKYGENGVPVGLVTGKKAIIASARGGVYSPGAPAAPLEHHETYLRGVLGFIGITDVTVIRAEGVAFGPEAKESALGKARAEIAALSA